MHDRLHSCNYPLPTTICGESSLSLSPTLPVFVLSPTMLTLTIFLQSAGMHLIHSFDEKFSKLDGSSGDFLNELSGELAANLSQNVVSLASFKGDYTVIWSFGFYLGHCWNNNWKYVMRRENKVVCMLRHTYRIWSSYKCANISKFGQVFWRWRHHCW